MTKEELLELLDCHEVFVRLHNCYFGDISEYFMAILEIDRLTSKGIIVKPNEYEVPFIPYEGFKKYWAMHKEDLE